MTAEEGRLAEGNSDRQAIVAAIAEHGDPTRPTSVDGQARHKPKSAGGQAWPAQLRR
jgi:hypothetical protein